PPGTSSPRVPPHQSPDPAGPANKLSPSMLASFPASLLNQIPPESGNPLRFNQKTGRSRLYGVHRRLPTQRDQDVTVYQREIQQAEVDKLLRLRALRLAKEAADKDARERAQPETPAQAQKAKPARRAKRSKLAPIAKAGA